VRAQFERHVLAARQASDAKSALRELARLETPLERARGRIRPDKLEVFLKSEDRFVRATAANLLRNFKWSEVEPLLAARLLDDFGSVREAAVESMIIAGGIRRAHAHVAKLSDDLLTGHVVEHLAYTRDVEVAVMLLGELAKTASHEIARRVKNAATELLRDDSLSEVTRAHLSLLLC
jgi:HEAT repeat protein